MKKIVYVDMDGVLCDYVGYCNENNLDPHDTDDVMGLFLNLKPNNIQIDAINIKIILKINCSSNKSVNWNNGIIVSIVNLIAYHMPK